MTDLLDRLADRFDIVDECWEWTGALDGGYGRIRVGNLLVLAHRASYELLVGPIPDELEVDHLCRNTACINPDHLEPVTHAENVRRGDGGRHTREKTHCPQGHAYDAENTYRYNGKRHCRTCIRAAVRRYRLKKLAAR